MTQTYEFLDARARAAEIAADEAELDNVRERELRSAKAWRDMADRARMIEAGRAKAETDRAERRAAEEAALRETSEQLG
jgi:hypothetical protein